MPTTRSLLAGGSAAMLLLAAVAVLVFGRDALDALLPVFDGPVTHAAAWAAVAGGCWLLVHTWNDCRRDSVQEPSSRAATSASTD